MVSGHQCGGAGQASLQLSFIDTTHEAGFSLSSFGGEGWGEEAHKELPASGPSAQGPAPHLEWSRGAAAITASSPHPSPPKEERGCLGASARRIVNQTQLQWGQAWAASE